jgi:hypothetical protein
MSPEILPPIDKDAKTQWSVSRAGFPYCRVAGLTLAIYPRGRGWSYRIASWDHRASIESPEPFLTVETAKRAGLAALPEARRALVLSIAKGVIR